MLAYNKFESIVSAYPDNVAVETSSSQVTYAELNQRANVVCDILVRRGVVPGSLIAILLPSTVDFVVAMLGILKSGCAYVPIDPEMPFSYQQHVVLNSQPVLIVTNRLSSIDIGIILGDQMKKKLLFVEDYQQTILETTENQDISMRIEDPLAYVIYTSGTTGKPNGVCIHNHGLCTLVDFCQGEFGIGPGFRVLQYATLSFDAMVFELFGCLLCGGTLCLSSREEMLPGKPLVETLQSRKINFICIPPSSLNGLNYAAPDLPDLKVLVVGGEKCPVQLSQTWSFGRRFYNAYGPTESTVCTLIHLCNGGETNHVPIGKVLPGLNVKLVDPETGMESTTGELWISGIGVSSGYLHNPSLTRERFSDGWFKTRDLVTLDQDAYLYLGRIDNMVKHRGYRVELEAIENTLNRYQGVRGAVVVQHINGSRSELVAFLLGEDVDIPLIRDWVQEQLPEYMHPSRYVLLESFPIMTNGSKVDRKKLQASIQQTTVKTEQTSDLEANIQKIFQNVIGTHVAMDDTLTQTGGNSMDAVNIINQINIQYGFQDSRLPVSTIYGKSTTVRQLANKVLEKLQHPSGIVSKIDYIREGDLDPSLNIQMLKPYVYQPFTKDTNIFVTGGTGYLGGQFVNHLLETTSVHVWVLVRCSNNQIGRERLIANLQKYRPWNPNYDQRISIVEGDLAQPLLGLSTENFQDLSQKIDVIYHIGADISYIKPYQTLKLANVQGTQEVLRLATTFKIKQIEYVSSMGVFGSAWLLHGWDKLDENSNYKQNLQELAVENGYIQTKWVAEIVIENAMNQGLPIRVYRPGFIESSTNGSTSNDADFFCRMLKGCIQLGYYPDLPYKYWIMTPVDYIANVMVWVGQRHTDQKIFHTIPQQKHELSNNQIFEALVEMGYNLQPITLKEWCNKLVEMLQSKDESNALYGVASYLTEKVYRNRQNVFEMHYVTSNCICDLTELALNGSGIQHVKWDKEVFQQYVQACINQGWFPLPTNQ